MARDLDLRSPEERAAAYKAAYNPYRYLGVEEKRAETIEDFIELLARLP